MSEMPVFDDVPPETSTPAQQPPKRKPRKPMKRRARRSDAPMPPGVKRRVTKKRAARRGRPPGALNKPKPVSTQPAVNFAALLGVHIQIQTLLSRLTPDERKAILDALK